MQFIIKLSSSIGLGQSLTLLYRRSAGNDLVFGSGNDVGYELPMIGLDVPVQLDEGLVAVRTHLLQGLPLVNPLHVDPQIESCTRFILTLVTLEVFYFLMNNPEMSQ